MERAVSIENINDLVTILALLGRKVSDNTNNMPVGGQAIKEQKWEKFWSLRTKDSQELNQGGDGVEVRPDYLEYQTPSSATKMSLSTTKQSESLKITSH